MSEKEQLDFILEICRKTRERHKPDLHKVWESQKEAYRRAVGGNLYSYGTNPYRSGHNLYTY